jgi:hypothetical protein
MTLARSAFKQQHQRGDALGSPSTILLCAYAAGGLVTLIGGMVLAYRRKIDSPILLTIFTLHELFLVLFLAFWPILGPPAIAELLYRGASHERRNKVPDNTKRKA